MEAFSMISCNEDCVYQDDGSCKLAAADAHISCTPLPSCGYYIKRQPENKNPPVCAEIQSAKLP